MNLNECKFGDKLRTESGEMVVYLGKTRAIQWGDTLYPSTFCCAIAYGEGFGLMELDEYGWNDKNHSNDIVGRWEDEIEKPAQPCVETKEYPKVEPFKGVDEKIKNYGKIKYV